MKIAILEKLSRELYSGIDTEPKALYLLAEIRKYIDGYNQTDEDKYPNLYFFCDWVLHIQMDRTPAKTILKRFQSISSGINNLKEISNNFIEKEKNFYLFADLKAELRNFLRSNGLPLRLVENSGSWFKFKKLLVEILMDCPLVNENERVSKFSFEKGADEQIRFRIKINKLGSFKITLKEKYKNQNLT